MSHDMPLEPPATAGLLRGPRASDAGAFVDAVLISPATNDTIVDKCQRDICQEFSPTCLDTNVENGEMATRQEDEPISRELRRFQLLVRILHDAGVSQAEMARRTGIGGTHINKLMNAEKYGYTGLSAEIVRKVREGLNLSTDFFFDPTLKNAKTETDLLNVYSLDERRERAWQKRVDDQLHELQTFRLELQSQLVSKDQEIGRLQRELAEVRSSSAKKRPTR
jgi:transcriptional regulator with XRE-family HTH domain